MAATKRLLVASTVSLVASLLAVLPILAASTGICDVSGQYTDRLCPGEAIDHNAYVASPNGRYRMYYTNNALVIYDTEDDWAVVDIWAPGSPIEEVTPDEFVYGDPTVESMYDGPMNIAFWVDDDELDYHWVFGWGGPPLEPVGDHALVIQNNGWVRVVDESGNRFLLMCPGSAC